MGALISFGLPTMDIASGKEPIAIVFFATRKFKFYKIKPYGSYFMIRDNNVQGVFEMDSTKAWTYEKVNCFFYDYRNAKPEDPVIVNELNEFARKNKLHKVTRTNVKQGSILRMLSKKNQETAHDKLKEKTEQDQNKLDQDINSFLTQLNSLPVVDKNNKPIPQPTEWECSFGLTQHLLQNNDLTEDEAMLLEERIRAGKITFSQLIDDLRTKELVTIQHPITIDIEKFLDDFHAFNPSQLNTHVDRVIMLDKKIKTMTSIPVKNWIPAKLVLAIMIGTIIGVMVIIQNWGMIQDGLKHILPQSTPPHLLLGLKNLIMSRLHS